MGRKHKLRGGLNVEGFYNETSLILQEQGRPRSEYEKTFEDFKDQIIYGDLNSSWLSFNETSPETLEFYFQSMKRSLQKGIYGDEYDKALTLPFGTTGERKNVYELMEKLLRGIDAQRILVKGAKFYKLNEWKEFYNLYKAIISRAFKKIREEAQASAPAPAPGPVAVKPSQWYKDRDATDEWYVNAKTGESSWELPPGGVEIPAPVPAKTPAPVQAQESAQIQSLSAPVREQIRNFRDFFRKIVIGLITPEGFVVIRMNYIREVRAAISKAFGTEVLIQIQKSSRSYYDLERLVEAIQTKGMTFQVLEDVIRAQFPERFAEIRARRLSAIDSLIEFIQIYEDGIVDDFVRFLPASGKGKRKLKGKALPDDLTVLQQIAKQSYNLTDPQEDVNGWILKKWTPTMKFYVKGNDVIVGVRGTKTNAPDGNFDVSADLTIPFNGIPGTTRYKRDKAAVQQFLQQFPSPEYSYYAVGHSLGGAIIDSLIRDKLIKEALSYNPAIQSGDINAGLPNRRIYFGSDPLYRLMGWLDRKSEHREPKNRTWADFLGAFSPAAAAMAALPAHNLSNFEGGKRGKLGKKVVFT